MGGHAEGEEQRAMGGALDALVEAELGRRFTACVVRVEPASGPVWQRAWGALGEGAAAPPAGGDSLFDLASLTKLYVATACLALIGRGVVGLADRVENLVPAFTGGARGEVTVRHLLSHTSGLPAHLQLFRTCRGPAEIVEAICGTPLEAAPGARVAYSCLGFILLGAALQRLSGQSLDALVDDLVVRPLGRAGEALYCPPETWQERIAPAEWCAWRGRRVHGEVHDENAAAMGGVSGNAGLFGTARAVAALGRLYREGGEAAGRQVVPRALAAEAVREQACTDGERRGLGWMLRSINGIVSSAGQLLAAQSYGHTGFTGTSLWVDPTRGLVVTVLTNRVYYGREATDLLAFRGAVHDAVARHLTETAEHGVAAAPAVPL